MLKEFKAFVMKGNMLDLAARVILGAAFSAMISLLGSTWFVQSYRMNFAGGLSTKLERSVLKQTSTWPPRPWADAFAFRPSIRAGDPA